MSQTIHRNTIEFEVCGDYALFSDVLTRPSGEKCTYDIPTYEAIKGIVHSIYFKPTILWKVDAVRIMNPIRTERKGMRPLKMNGENDLAYYTYLRNVCYQVRTLSGTKTIRNWRATAMRTSITTLQSAWLPVAADGIFFSAQENARAM